MKKQNQIKKTLTLPENYKQINNLLDNNGISNISQLAKIICKKFNFRDFRDKLQLSSCIVALKQLDKQKHIVLPFKTPKPSKKRKSRTPLRLAAQVDLPKDVPIIVGDVKNLELQLVQDKQSLRIWNELMISEHPIGKALLAGRQIRYLINSEHGYLGGFGFSSAALHLSDRDKWIGWDKETMQSYLQYIVNMSRFLIRPSVRCKNLASKTLSMCMARIADDFMDKYNYKPLLLESFVDTTKYTGSCYKASNWIQVGQTKGRGRQDTKNQYALTKKSIYMYPLEKNFRELMSIKPKGFVDKIEITSNLDNESWASHEFNNAPIGNKKNKDRLIDIASVQALNPGAAFSQCVKGNWAQTKGYYRLIDKPDDSAMTMKNIMQPHRMRTKARMASQQTVLCLQDDSELNYTNLSQCKGLGYLKTNQTGAKMKGIVLHSTMATSTSGLPLGIINSDYSTPQEKTKKDPRKPHKIPLEEKKTHSWVKQHQDLVKISKQIPNTQLVHVCDRESDFYEFFEEQQKESSVDVLIRANHNRNISTDKSQKPDKLFNFIQSTKPLGQTTIALPSKSARVKKSKQKASKFRPARNATLTIYARKLSIPAPSYYPDRKPIKITIIYAFEENPPIDVEPIKWYLLTTLKVKNTQDAITYLDWYTKRWRIEDFFRVLKSGCKITKLKLNSATRLTRAIAINSVIAWRIMLMTLLGREQPELPCEVLFSNPEMLTLNALVKKKVTNQEISNKP